MPAGEHSEAQVQVSAPVGGEGGDEGRCARAAAELLRAAEHRGVTVAIAESLTGGQVSSTLVGVPGASRVLTGAVVAYAILQHNYLQVAFAQLRHKGFQLFGCA